MLAKEYISSVIPTLNPLDSAARALRLMNEYHLSQLPLVEENNYIELVDETDILDWDDPDSLLENLHDRHFKPAIQENEHFLEALRICNEFKLSAIPVINKKEEFLGVIPFENLLHGLSQFNDFKESGGLLVLEMESKDYSLAEISRITESNDIIVIGMHTWNDPVSGKLEVLLKTNRQDLQSLVATFERFSYTVAYRFGEQEEEGMLRKNYDLFMNYLSL